MSGKIGRRVFQALLLINVMSALTFLWSNVTHNMMYL